MTANTPAAADDDRPPRGPNDLERRVDELTKGNASLVQRNRNLAAKTRQAEAMFATLAERMYAGAIPAIAEIERAQAYFHDTQLFDPDFVWPIGHAGRTPPPDDQTDDYPGNS